MQSAIVVPEHHDSRPDIPYLCNERELLDAWLTLYRQTVLLKAAGLTAHQLALRPLPSTDLSLIGIVRHLTVVERYWLRDVLHGEDTDDLYSSRERPDADFLDADADTASQDIATYRAEIEATMAATLQWTDLDIPVRGRRHGQELNLRWILTHLIEEYARHVGHMDLLREAIDGSTGY